MHTLRLNPRNIRRLTVLSLLAAPIIYLFGSLFTALNGAHGQEVFAEPVYVEQYVEVDNFGSDGSYRFDFDVESFVTDAVSGFGVNVSYTLNGVEYLNIRGFEYTGNRYYVQARNEDTTAGVYYSYNRDTGNYSFDLGSPWVIYCDADFVNVPIPSQYYTLYRLVSVPSSEIPENAGAYSDYVFKNFFAKDNFLVQGGRNVLSDNPYGFSPFADFFKYIDANMLHLDNSQVGLMAYGYAYWCAHVLIFDVLFMVVTFFLSWISNITDKVNGGSR